MKRRLIFTLPILIASVLAAPASFAEVTSQATAASTGPVTPAPVPPVVSPENELAGKALLDALRAGGLVLYMRHALQLPPTPGPCQGPSLQPEGEAQARRVGEAIRRLGIPVSGVLTSEPCRNRDTARLLGLGEVEVTQDLNPAGLTPGFDIDEARRRRLIELPPAGTNTVLVSHLHGSKDKSAWMHLELAEIIVYRPDGRQPTPPVARIRVEQWDALLKLAPG